MTKRALGLENAALKAVIIAAYAKTLKQDQTIDEHVNAGPGREERLGELKSALGLPAQPLQLTLSPLEKAEPALAQAYPPAAPNASAAKAQPSSPDGAVTSDTPEAPDTPNAPADGSVPAAISVRQPAPETLPVQQSAMMLDQGPAPDEPAPGDGSDGSAPLLAADPHNRMRRAEKASVTYALITAMPEADTVTPQAPSPVAETQSQESADGIVAIKMDSESGQRAESEVRDIAAALAEVEKTEAGNDLPFITVDPTPAIIATEFTVRAGPIEPLPSQSALLAASHNLQLARQILLPLVNPVVSAPVALTMLELPIIETLPDIIALPAVDLPVAGAEIAVAQESLAATAELAAERIDGARSEAVAVPPPPMPVAQENTPLRQLDEWRPTIIERAAALAGPGYGFEAARETLLPRLFGAVTVQVEGTALAAAELELASGAVEAGPSPAAVAAHIPSSESLAAPVEIVESGKSALTSEPAQSATANEEIALENLDELPVTEEDRSYAANPAAPSDSGVNPMQGDLLAVHENQLDEVRGGFLTDNGLQISFGIERAVYVNGNLIATTSLNVSDLSKLSAGQASPGGLAPGSLGLIQIGPGNTFQPGTLSPASVATVIQNTLNDQKIQNVTTISATVNSLEVLKGLNLQSSLRNAITDSLRR